MCHFDTVSLRYSYAGGKKKPENNLHMPKIEKPLKEIVRQNNFLGLSSKNGSPRDWRVAAKRVFKIFLSNTHLARKLLNI